MTTTASRSGNAAAATGHENGPLIGVDNIELPAWAEAGQKVATAGWWRAVRALPATVAVVVRLAWETSPRLTALAAVVHVASGVVTAFGLLATAQVFTALLEQGPTPERVLQALPALAVVVASYAARAVLDAAVAAVEGALRPRVTMAADHQVTAALVRVRLLAHEDAEFRELARQGGRLGVQSIQSSLRQVAALLSAAISVIAAVVAAGLLHPLLAPALLLAAIAEGWASAKIAKLRYGYFVATVTRNMRRNVIEDAATSRELALERHALTLQEPLLAEHRRIAESLARDEVALSHRSTLVRLIGRAAAGLGTAASYVLLGFLLYQGALPLALAGTAVLAMRTAATALANSMYAINMLYEDAYYVEHYQRLMDEAAQRRPRPSPITAPAHPAEIRLDNVSFTYPGQDQPALQDLSITLRRGETVALVGENGSGKSTLGKVIAGLYPPSAGTIWWDDVDLATADEHSVHSRVAVIAQDPGEWPMTAGRNITIGRLDRDDTDRTAWHTAVTKSGADDVLATLPHGENTLLSRHFAEAQDLSGGQWQRLGIARGLYRDAAVLIADEPTAALDAKAEARVFTALRHAATNGPRDRITILVTHRLANVRTADRILVLADGRLAEHGTHNELLTQRGLYHELYQIQARAYATTPHHDV